MTREEQIKKEAESITHLAPFGHSGRDMFVAYEAFALGAKWADEHPNLYNNEKYHTVKVSDLDRLYKKLEVYEKYFDKTSEWLEGRDYEFEYLYSEDGYTFFDNEKFINDFRKAMEE